MFNKERKERCRKRENKLSKNDNNNIKKSTHKSKTKRKNRQSMSAHGYCCYYEFEHCSKTNHIAPAYCSKVHETS